MNTWSFCVNVTHSVPAVSFASTTASMPPDETVTGKPWSGT